MKNVILRLLSSYLIYLPSTSFKRRIYRYTIKLTRSSKQILKAISKHKCSYYVYSNDYAGSNLYTTGEWEPYVTQTIKSHLEEGSVFIDVGANFGYYSAIASKIVGEKGVVHSFECAPKAIQMLKRNISLNNCTNVELHEHALSDETGTTSFFASKNDTGHSSLDEAENSLKITVATKRFDDMKLNQISLIKIDVEGAELRVLKGMMEALSCEKPPYVVCEISTGFDDRGGDSAKDIFDFMEQLNYRAEYIPVPDTIYGPYSKLDNDRKIATHSDMLLQKHPQRDVLFSPTKTASWK